MINIYTSRKLLPDRNILNSVDDFFIAYVSQKQFESYDLEVMYKIDTAELLDRELGTIKTPFGVTDINHLSSGCKTVLDYLYITRNAEVYAGCIIDVTECGYNALECLFEQMDRLHDDITLLLLQHTDCLQKCCPHQFLVNGKYKVNSLSDILELMEE